MAVRKRRTVRERRALLPCVGGGRRRGKEEDSPHGASGAGAELGCRIGGGEGGAGGAAGDGDGSEEERWIGNGEESRRARDGGGKKNPDEDFYRYSTVRVG